MGMRRFPNMIVFCFFLIWQAEDDVPPVSFFQVMRLNLSELPFIVVGVICAIINGAMQPLFAILFSKIITVSSEKKGNNALLR